MTELSAVERNSVSTLGTGAKELAGTVVTAS